uniref:Large ribosomal subunit protein mL39 n=1 Tax=Lepisosteus oculatus TaxID=7918 RepID=W5MXL4_LEPOC
MIFYGNFLISRSINTWTQSRAGLASNAAVSRPSVAELLGWRSQIFSREQAKQRALYPRTEKIEVTLEGPGLQGTVLIMNRGVSTPYSCARHLTEWHVSTAALALVDGQPWPLHRPLTQSCTLSLLSFKDQDPQEVNQAYWRSCAMMLGQVLQAAFKEEFLVELLRSPELPVISGAFCCDVVLDSRLDSWTPSEEDLRSFGCDAQRLIQQDLPWEPLEVQPAVAMEIFTHSRTKREEVEQRTAESPTGTVTLYRCGDHVDVSGGPLVARTGLCSQYEVTALHNLGPGPWGLHRRAQGLSLPLQLQAHHTIWRRLKKRAEQLVEVPPVPSATHPQAPTPAPEV